MEYNTIKDTEYYNKIKLYFKKLQKAREDLILKYSKPLGGEGKEALDRAIKKSGKEKPTLKGRL